MAKHDDRTLLRLIREHLDAEALMREHPEVSEADLEALWRRYGLDAPVQRELFAGAGDPSRPLKLTVRCDGAARGNPGPAAVGAVVQDQDGDTLLEVSECIGRATNNVAEYQAVIRGVEQALLLKPTEIELLLDSDLLVNQLRGTYKVRSPHLQPLRDRAVHLLRRVRRWSVRHVPRRENTEADALANRALDGR